MAELKPIIDQWNSEWHWLQGLIGSVLALVAFLTPPLRKARKFVYNFLIGPSRIGPIEERLGKIEKQLTPRVGTESLEDRLVAIEKQLHPNGGSSLCDRIDAIGRDLSINTQMTRAAFPTPRFLADKDGKFVWVSQAWCATVWLSDEACAGVGWMQMICEKDREAVIREWRACIADHRQFIFTFCVRRGTTTPERIEVEMQADPLPQGFFLGSLKEVAK